MAFFFLILFEMVNYVKWHAESVFGGLWIKPVTMAYRWHTPSCVVNDWLSQNRCFDIFTTCTRSTPLHREKITAKIRPPSTFHCQSHSTSVSSVIKPALSDRHLITFMQVWWFPGADPTASSAAPVLRDPPRAGWEKRAERMSELEDNCPHLCLFILTISHSRACLSAGSLQQRKNAWKREKEKQKRKIWRRK